jgi:hypothetical protein
MAPSLKTALPGLHVGGLNLFTGPRLISKILRFFLKLVLGIFAAVFAVSLLVAALIVVR